MTGGNRAIELTNFIRTSLLWAGLLGTALSAAPVWGADAVSKFTLHDVLLRYGWFITGALLALGLILLLGVRLLLTMRRLRVEITERQLTTERLQLAESRRASVFAHALEAIMITDANGTIIDVNEAFSRITGYSRTEVLGQNPHILSPGRHGHEFYTAMWRDLQEKGFWYGEVWTRRKNGEVYAQLQNISAVRDAQGVIRQYISLFSDITTFKEQQRQLEHLAHFDALTELPNRVLLADRLHQGMVQAQRRGQMLALVFLDLDGFKRLNDDHGHQVGDHMLTTLASRMTQALREGDTLARVGGDEFVAVLIDLADAATCEPMLQRLLTAAAEPVQLGELTLQVSASMGITFYPQAQELGAEQLLRQADQAMYRAKAAGKNRYQVFEAD
jgi:diguanylate cyclase (GGDEF)-like protein/PAS domain S-box-containing protein